MKHQWPAKANFLHFPKIEVISNEDLVKAVSLAGLAELTASIGEEPSVIDSHEASTVVAQPTQNMIEDGEEFDENEEAQAEQPMHVSAEDDQEIENIEVVAAESLGFGNEDIEPVKRNSECFQNLHLHFLLFHCHECQGPKKALSQSLA